MGVSLCFGHPLGGAKRSALAKPGNVAQTKIIASKMGPVGRAPRLSSQSKFCAMAEKLQVSNMLDNHEPIAITGLACRFPGGANTPAAFWQLLSNGLTAITEIPPDRFDIEAYYDPAPATPGKVMSRWGGFLDHIDQFDARFFGISPREADLLDPQQRLLLEAAWEALDDAGQTRANLLGSQTGVFIGLWINDYEARLFRDPARAEFYMTTGSGRYSAAGRLSYTFGFQGPSLTLDTACSSSLVAVHHAVQSLRRGECDLAVVGAANIILQPHITIAYSQSRMMAPDGRCKFGDARANGYVRSEGVGVIVLKRGSQAQRDQDRVQALILGSAVNNDGRSSGFLTTPGGAGQEAALRKAYQDAGISPGQAHYVEAHGTGTRAGDPVEIAALGAVLALDRSPDRPCLIGSVKTNIGHTEGAAGLAGLIKVVLAMQHRQIPASLHVEELTPNVPWATLPVKIQRELGPWPVNDGPLIAGVSAFGIAGTNAHVVLQDAPGRGIVGGPSAPSPAAHHPPFILPLSAHTPAALTDLARAYQSFLASDTVALADVCYTASVRRTQHDYRLVAMGDTRETLIEQLRAFERAERPIDPVVEGPGQIAFVCPGQGSQWLGMGRQLFECDAIFRATIERCDAALRAHVDWSLIEQLTSATARLDDIDVIQPVLCAISIALADVWRARGVQPDAVVGHSLGEVAAAYIAGALELDDALRLICTRSRLLKRVSGRGAMAVVNLSLDAARAALRGYEDRLAVAVSNSPTSSVLSGEPGALAAVIETLQARHIFCRPVKVDVAAHSPQLDALRGELVDVLTAARHACAAATLPIYSTVTGQTINGEDLEAAYWGRNLREPVLFSTAVQRMLDAGITAFIELSPQPILLAAIEQGWQARQLTGLAVPSLRRAEDEPARLWASFSALYTHGYAIDWRALYPHGQVVSLPGYPWQRQRFWFETPPTTPGAAWPTEPDHPLLGYRLPDLAPLQPGSRVWQNSALAGRRASMARDSAAATWPDEVYRDLALTAARLTFGDRLHTLSELAVPQPIPISETELTLQTILTPAGDHAASVQIFSRSDDRSAWQKCVTATLAISSAERDGLYTVTWQALPRAPTVTPRSIPAGRWLIFSDSGMIGSRLAAALIERGDQCLVVTPGESFTRDPDRIRVNPARREDFQRLFDEAAHADQLPLRGVIYLWGLTAHAQAVTCGGALYLIQSLAHFRQASAPRVWFVTCGAQRVTAESALAVEQATLWGLGRVIAVEHPDLWGGLIDLDPDAAHGAGAALLAEIVAPDHEDQIALRADRRYVARLTHTPPSLLDNGLPLRSTGSYLITGGLGGLGLLVAQWLARRGAPCLVLVGRHAPQQPAREIIQELERAGTHLVVRSGDVSQAADVTRLIGEIDQTLPPLRGIIHAAGALDDGVLLLQDWARFASVFAPKVEGAWQLHTATQNHALDFFVMFSSITSLLGIPGQANYAAANAFLDALAQHRRATGQPALSINWGGWAEVGLAVQAGRRSRLALRGLEALSPAQGLEALDYLLRRDLPQTAVVNIHWPTYFKQLPTGQPSAFLSDLAPAASAVAPSAPTPGRSDILRQLENTAPADRVEALIAYVRQQVAGILRFDTVDAIEPQQGFFRLGMDSLMAVELRNRLQADIGRPLPPTLTFDYPTVNGLARYLGATLFPAVAAETTEAAATSPELDDLSKDELNALLAEELRAIDQRQQGGLE